jgi:hypothetical protein
MLSIYTVLDENDDEVALHVHCTTEGLIVDLYDQSGECVATWALTAQEFTDRYFLTQHT